MSSITLVLSIGALVAISIINAHRFALVSRKAGESVWLALAYLLPPVALTLWVAVAMMNWRKK